MTEKQALIWMLGILGSVCAGAVTVDKVLDIIHKYVKKAQAPDAEQNKRLDEKSSGGSATSRPATHSTARPSSAT